MNELHEHRLLDAWWDVLRRSPLQVNAIHEADAELIQLPENARLAITTDSIVEELSLGFYPDPETVGWVAVMSSLSDLAAVAAEPFGLVVSVTLPQQDKRNYQRRLAQGLDEACAELNTYVLGGDTNIGSAPAISATAIGWVRAGVTLTRAGAVPGQALYCSGKPGRGAAVAASALFGDANVDIPPFRPVARVREAQLIARYASACMDTSDGLLATVDQLARVNNIGFSLDPGLISEADPIALSVMGALELPSLMTLASLHGEFELAFTVPPEACADFEQEAAAIGWRPLLIGQARTEHGVWYGSDRLETGRIRNAFDELAPIEAVALISKLLP